MLIVNSMFHFIRTRKPFSTFIIKLKIEENFLIKTLALSLNDSIIREA